jgi:hypothetical protein
MMLETGYDIFISDADVVWFGNPWPVVGGRKEIPVRPDSIHLATADVLASTDCIDFLEDMGPGIAGHEQNTGMLFLRATAAAVEFTVEWQVQKQASAKCPSVGWMMPCRTGGIVSVPRRISVDWQCGSGLEK